jgi:hypothetical protein
MRTLSTAPLAIIRSIIPVLFSVNNCTLEQYMLSEGGVRDDRHQYFIDMITLPFVYYHRNSYGTVEHRVAYAGAPDSVSTRQNREAGAMPAQSRYCNW